MKYFVKAEVFESIYGVEDVKELREGVGKQFEKIAATGKMIEGGVLTGKRAFFLILDVDSPKEVYDLLGFPIVDRFRMECYPIMSFEELGQFFKRDAIK